ncbi:STAS domain-containing protein [Desulfonatronum thiosulfatophilum]|uniref:STAS domain-containing protein n=1 Tax=Desulfonatronum thiosulfatophilum TaxID=617002 RepID=A0A1G6ED97_9BACT|nr:response regulator [Desulfonatronum thiosulfatophilum]SDB55404.1 STAS domain-containing protein [Desulfonatronum thiosulfatophilum]
MRKILVIDDEKPTLSMFRLFLNAYGFTVFTAENGEDGLDVFQKEDPAIVITDIKMPGMDGLEVLKRIKELNPLAEVIIITGHGDLDLAIRALNMNATDFINKPIQRSALDQALRRAEERLAMAESEEKDIAWDQDGELACIDIRGNVNAASEPLLLETYGQINERNLRRILFRFSENASVNGAGIAVLIQLLTESKNRDQAVIMTGLAENFRKVFEMVGVTKLARIMVDETEARKQLKSM